MKLEDLPEYAKKYKTKGYDVKKVDNFYYLYKVTHKRTKDKAYPVTKFEYIGKIDENKGLIKAWTQENKENIQYLEYGLSNYFYRNYKRAVQRSLFNVSRDNFDTLFRLGIIDCVFGKVTPKVLSLSYLTYKLNSEIFAEIGSLELLERRIKIISNKLKKSLEAVIYNEEDRLFFTNSLRNMNCQIVDGKEKISTVFSTDVKEISEKYRFKL